jgi:spore coat protein U-like protein
MTLCSNMTLNRIMLKHLVLLPPNSVRLKNVTVTSGTVSARNMAVADPAVSKSGTWSSTGTTVTVTINGNGLVNGQRVFLDVAAGTTMRDGVYDSI